MKAKFGAGQFSKHSPKWLVPTFAATILAVGVVQFLVTGDPEIPDELKIRINHYLTGFTMFVSGIAPLFGVDAVKKDTE
jgi:hypothetical protein